MKILITGATGLIGKELTKLLLSNNHQVNYLTTDKDKIKSEPNYQGYYWNPSQDIIDNLAINEVSVIIHLAGANIAKRWTENYKNEILQSRLQSTDLLFKTLKNNPNHVKQFISASGTAIYPESYDIIYDESCTEIHSGFLSNVVVKWEEAVNQFGQLGIKVAKLRTAMVLSNKEGALPKMLKPIQLGIGSTIGNGKQLQTWIHILDLVEMYYYVIKNQLDGTFNAVAPQSISNLCFTKTIAEKFNKRIFLPTIPMFIMKMSLGEMSFLLFSSKKISANKIQNLGFKFKFLTLKDALDDLY